MRTLKSGVYFVRYKDIDKFFKHAEISGWQEGFDNTQAEIYDDLKHRGRDDKTIKQMVIPCLLDKEQREVGYWPKAVCLESEVEEAMKTWDAWFWTERYIEYYQSKKLIL